MNANDDDYIVSEKEMHQKPIPSEGLHQAVCAFVEPVGFEANKFEPQKPAKKKLWLCWELDENMTGGEYDGMPFMLSKKYTASLHEKSNLLPDLISWRKKRFTTEELAGFDIRTVKGKGCSLMIAHEPRHDGAVDATTKEPILIAKIKGIFPPDPKKPALVVRGDKVPDFILKERENNARAWSGPQASLRRDGGPRAVQPADPAGLASFPDAVEELPF